MAPTLRIDEALHPCPCLPALIWAEEIAAPELSEQLPDPLAELVTRAAAAGESFWPPDVKGRVRQMLRHGKYKPSGRAKPASEFLLKAAMDGRFPAIHPPVNVNNAVSLESGLPGSIFDTDRSGDRLLLRRGRADERYVFNPSGQEIELTDLLLVARDGPDGGVACGNPVKDSMATKIQADTRRVVAVLYAPRDESPSQVEAWAKRFAALLSEWCQAREVGYLLVEPPA
ncbi:MAG: phenylalanine--tRNA ligase beta subunit-related protein [bacterium]